MSALASGATKLMKSLITSSALCFLGLLCAPACDAGSQDESSETSDSGGDESGGDMLDEAEVQAKLDAFPTGFTKINDQTVQTQAHTAAMTVDVWVEDAWVSTFLEVDPDAMGSEVSFDQGATIIKEQFDADGVLDSMTVMVKAEAGFNPDVGDWWWGFTNASAQLQNAGVIDACISCHVARPNDDFVFGVPLDNRL